MSVRVIVQINPLSLDRKDLTISPCKINEIITKIDPSGVIDSGWRIMVNDEIVTDFEKSVKDNDTVYIKVVPEGGDNKDTGKGMSWAGASMVVLGTVLVMTGVGAGFGVALIGAGVGCLASGIALYNTDIPTPKTPNAREAPEQDPSLRGSSNQMRQYGYVPALFGRRRIYADIGCQYYTWVEGGKQYLYELFCAGQASQQIDTSTIKIEDTLLTEFSLTKDMSKILSGQDGRVQLSIAYGQSVPPLLTKCVHESQHNSTLTHLTDDNQDASFVETTVDGTEEIHVDIFFPNGLGKYDNQNNLCSASVQIVAQFKLDGQPDSAYQTLGYFAGNSNVISGSELKTKRYSIHRTGLAAGKYTVRITRVTEDHSDNSTVDKCYVGSLRSIKNESPVSSEKCRRLTLIGLKVGVSEKLNGLVEQLNFESTSIPPVPTGTGATASDWSQKATSANPASCAIWVMKGDMAQQKLGDNEIDWYAFKKLYDWCASHQYECNAYLSESMTTQQLLSSIASTCRAEIFRVNGKITVIQDIERSTFVQVFTPRNSWDYEETISFNKIPDALAVGFNNKEKGYADDELKLYNTQNWQKESEPDEVTNVSTWGVTNSRQARMIGIYKYAVTKNRPFIANFKCDIEYMLCRKGDWIKYAGDVALAGISQGRIKTVIVNNNEIIGIESDEKLPMESGKRYAIRIRRNDATFVLKEIEFAEGDSNFAEFLIPLELGEIQEENLFTFGVLDNDSVDLVITDITCEEGLTASITAVSYAPEIFGLDAPDYVLPPFTSNLSDVSAVIDSGEIQVNKWQTFYTYNDSALTPETPTGDGTSGTWHRVPNLQSRWVSYKIAKDINSGSWSAPKLTTDEQLQQIINGNTESVGNPDDVTGFTAKATKDGLQIDWNANATGLKNVIDRYKIEISLDDGETYGIELLSKNNSLFYTFPANAFYEEEDFLTWYVRIKAVNAYSGESASWTRTRVTTAGYGTWQLQTPNVYVREADRTLTLFLSQPERSDGKQVYGTIRYRVQVRRPEKEESWFKPATSSDPEASENNYKDGEGYVVSDEKYIQKMPLAGQDTDNITDTLYQFRIQAQNEAGTSEFTSPINAVATCTNIKDFVKANAEQKKLYVWALSVLAANVGTITEGAFGDGTNRWDLSTFVDEYGVHHYKGQFSLGDTDEYLRVIPILEEGHPTGRFEFQAKFGVFEFSAEATKVNGEFIIQKDENSLDRTRIAPHGTYYEHRGTVDSNWSTIAKQTTSGLLSQILFSDESLLITNMSISTRRALRHDIGKPYITANALVYHFDTDLFNQNGSASYTLSYGTPPVLVDESDNLQDSVIDFSPAILKLAPYSEIGRSLYGQYSLIHPLTGNEWTVDFWIKYIWSENQTLFDIGNETDRIKIIISSGEPNYNEYGDDEPPYNYEVTEASEPVYNVALGEDVYLFHSGQNEEYVKLSDLGISFISDTWMHFAVVLTSDKITVFIGTQKKEFTRWNVAQSSSTAVFNAEKNSFCLDELYIDVSAEAFESFRQSSLDKIPWGSLDYTKKHFILDTADTDYFHTNLFDSQLFKDKVLEVINENTQTEGDNND